MTGFDRYFLNQLCVSFGFFSLIFVSVFWVNGIVLLFEELIGQGHSLSVFFEFCVLTLAKAAAIVFPVSAFAAAVYVTNRLNNESEMTILRATGMSVWRLSRPVVLFGCLVMLLTMGLNHILTPMSERYYKVKENLLSADLAAKLLKEGQFIHPESNVTIFIEEISESGELKRMFLSDRRQDTRLRSYSAETAYLLKQDENTRLVMVNGLMQSLDTETKRLSVTEFEDLTYDLGDLFQSIEDVRFSERETPSLELIPLLFSSVLPASSKTAVATEVNRRTQKALIALFAALIGFSCLMSASFSRVGNSRVILIAIFVLIASEVIDSMISDRPKVTQFDQYLIYSPSLFLLAISLFLITVVSDKLHLRKATYLSQDRTT